MSYLGRRYDLAARHATTEPLLYASRHLVTHGLVAGMTGSGKTGLCCALIEEAAIDGIPALVIDPQGDLGNLLLTFPELRPPDFAPWVNAEDARRLGLSAGDLAPCAAAASQAKNYGTWAKDFALWVQNHRSLRLLHSPSLRLTSRPNEEEREFWIRLQPCAHEQRDLAVEELRREYAPKLAAVQERLRRAEAAQEREAGQVPRAQLDTIVSVGSTLLGAFFGRKAVSSTTVGRAA